MTKEDKDLVRVHVDIAKEKTKTRAREVCMCSGLEALPATKFQARGTILHRPQKLNKKIADMKWIMLII